MSNLDDDFRARAKRVRARSGDLPPMPARARIRHEDNSDRAAAMAILRPQLALILGAVALILGRSVAMNHLGVEASPELLASGEAGLVFLLLLPIGLLFGRSDAISHGALVVGAALAFLCEGFYIPLAPDLMESVYTPDYVTRVLLYGH